MGNYGNKLYRYAVAGSLFGYINKGIAKFAKRVRKHIDARIGQAVRYMVFRKGEINPNKIFVMTFDNRYSDNQKYIVEEILRQKLPLDIVWTVSLKDEHSLQDFPQQIRFVDKGSYAMFEEMATASVWLDNALNCVWYGMPKKESQLYLNTWHGSMGIKRLQGDRGWMKRAARCNKVTDYCITNSTFEENVFRETFWKDVPFLKFGHARNDILFDGDRRSDYRRQLNKYLGIAGTDHRFFLYAPTFRDDKSMDWFDLDFPELKKQLENRFGGDWIILLRLHFKNRNEVRRMRIQYDWLCDVTDYADMQELLAAVDAGLTDYSSWAYDYVLTGRPLFLYAPDVEQYDQERGFYYPLDTTPFPIAYNKQQLSAAIAGFDEEEYREKVDRFLKEKGCYEDGHAAERIVSFIKEKTGINAV